MAFQVKGYVTEKPRVGAANSAFTATPDNLISDAFAYGSAYPSSEANPRTDYLVFVVDEGDLSVATFGWTKNEVVTRFDYSGLDQRFIPLPGSAPTVVGKITPTVNTTRLKVRPPVTPTTEYPLRVSLGTGTGTTLTATTVAQDSGFTVPGSMSALSVEISRGTGNLNFSADVVSAHNGETVRYQQQSFFALRESNGKIGLVGSALVLNPIPGLGAGSAYQIPLVRIGYSPYLTAISVVNDAAFGAAPPTGSFKWSAETGTIHLSTADLATYAGQPVYYDGSCYGWALPMPKDAAGTVGTVGTPLTLTNMPPAGGDLIFRIPSISHQFPETIRVEVGAFDPVGKKGQVQTDKLGNVRFSDADKALFGALTFEVIRGDLPIEHGLSIRLFRTPADPGGTDTSSKDVTALYATTDAIFADPIIGTPLVNLPAIPRDDGTLVVKVAQGTGSFTSTSLPRLDGPSPTAGIGYIVNFDSRQIQYAQRRNNELIPLLQASGGVQLPDPLVLTGNAIIELETGTGTGTYTTLTPGVDALLDGTTGTVQFVQTDGAVITTGTSGSIVGVTLTDATGDFLTKGVTAGDILNITSGSAVGLYLVSAASATTLTVGPSALTSSSFTYEIRRGQDVIADRFFKPVSTFDPSTKVERIRGFRSSVGALVPVTNSPRLTVNVGDASRLRFRFGASTFSTSVTTVANDGAFTSPGSLAAGVIQISLSTGNLNFSSVDVAAAGPVYAVQTLQESVDYRIRPVSGLIQTIERLLQYDELLISYVSADGGSTAPLVERGTFLVRKEAVADHPSPTTVLHFNPAGRTIAPLPAPAVFRGGRPQTMGVTCTVDTAAGEIRFIDDGTVTDAIPHGPLVKSTERVFIDYYIYEALGGENTLTVARPPISFTQVSILGGATSFTLPGNRTADLPVGYLLRLDGQEVYRITASTYDGTLTTVSVSAPFRDDLTAPKIDVSSGPCPTTGSIVAPAYFIAETAPLGPLSRGSNTLRLTGDRTALYASGVVVEFTNGTFDEFYFVSGSSYDAGSNVTSVTLTAPTARQYTGLASLTMRRTVRPVFEGALKSARTTRTPILTQPYLVVRQTAGSPGHVLSSPADYRIDDGGGVTLTTPLSASESLSVLYTGYRMIGAGPRVRASYTAVISPNTTNGLAGQILKGDYRVYSPDTFYYRVETLTNFKAEVALQYEADAKSSVPTSGPTLSNGSSPKLYQQGREGAFFREGRLANEDIIARALLKYYNDSINLLEDVLQNLDGRVVGDRDGRFKYDGSITNPIRTSFAAVTNQIDDVLKISDAPYSVVFPPFPAVFTSVGTYTTIYKPNPFSRFFSTARTKYSMSTAGSDTAAKPGDPVCDVGFKKLKTLTNLRRRIPRARIMVDGALGATSLTVDNANGSATLLRPPFQVGMKVIITGSDGTPYVTDGSPLTVGSVGASTLGVTLPVAVPAGASVYLAPSDTTYDPFLFRVGLDVGVDLDAGQLLYIANTIPLFTTKEIASGEFLQMDVTLDPTALEPEKIPALFGGTTDDDGDVAVPMIGPSFEREKTLLADELTMLSTITAATTPTFLGVGGLDGSRTVITLTSGAFPSPVPKVNDLARITDGLNGSTTFRRIVAVGASSVTVASAFSSVDTGFHFTVAVSNDVTSGSGTFPTSTTFLDGSKNFVTLGVQVGQTLILTSGPALGERRTITSVAPTVLGFSSAFSSSAAANYRVSTAMATFETTILGSVVRELAVLRDNDPLAVPGQITSEKLAIERFLDSVFTDLLSPTSQTGTVSGSTLTGTTLFQTAGLNPSEYVYIRSGANGGIYSIATVPTETTLTTGVPFPGSGSVSYRVVSAFGVGKVGLTDLYCILQGVDNFIAATTTFQASASSIAVVGDAGAFASGLTSLASRVTDVTTRLATVNNISTGPVGKVENVLSGGDRLYDLRYTWVDHRINVEKGVIVRKSRAVDSRLKALDDQTKALTKLSAIKVSAPTLPTTAEATYSSTCT